MPWLALALLLMVSVPFLWKPVHIDDANFLVLAQGARTDPWRPHETPINWQGHTERAFDVLSNPPGIGWWLAPLAEAPTWAQHLWMLAWLPLAVWGAGRLGRSFANRPTLAALLLVGSPIGLLSAQALTPDLPLLACTLAGAGGLITARPGRRWPWALLMGTAALFRYSGIALIPLAAAWPALHRSRRDTLRCGLAAALPITLLALHDLHAYGQSHLLAMAGFQGIADSGRESARKLAAAIAMLGGAATLPLLAIARPRPATTGALLGAALGIAAALASDHHGVAALGTVAACAAGGASLAAALSGRDRASIWATLWLVGGLVFLLRLRFTAARYWLPFFAPAVLIPLRAAPPRLAALAAAATLCLSVLLAADDLELAVAQRDLAEQMIAATHGEAGLFAGHWGWQHHLTAAGWRPLEEDTPIEEGQWLAVSRSAWPQEPGPGCRELIIEHVAPDRWPGPRVHTIDGAANLHAHLIAGAPPLETYAPWGLGRDPLDRAQLWRGCAGR
ncbi:MAG: hypothetical protein ACI8S6_003341 [Myxococcota bacterium]